MGKKKNSEKKTELAVQHSEVPSWLTPIPEDKGIEGLENMRPSDLLVPRLMLMQALSPQVVEGDQVAGEILNSITGEVWVEKENVVEFIPIYHYLEWIKWDDRESGGGILDRSLDPDGNLAQLAMRRTKRTNKAGREVFVVTEYHNFVAIFSSKSIKMPVVISCAKTNIKKGRKLLGLARYRGRYPLYAGKYTLQAILEKNSKGQQYYVFEFFNAGWTTEHEFEDLSKLYQTLKEAFLDRRLLSHQQEESKIDSDETEM